MKNIAEESQLRKAGQSDLDAIKRVATSLLYEDVIVNERLPLLHTILFLKVYIFHTRIGWLIF